jgi:hypothetical protein
MQYKVVPFLPQLKGCGASDRGWDSARCAQYEEFLNSHAAQGWKLHSSEHRYRSIAGCGGKQGVTLVCTFEMVE